MSTILPLFKNGNSFREPAPLKMEIRSIVSRLFRPRQRRVGIYQKNSPLFKLPLEIRNEIYMYIFASALVHDRTNEPFSDWDHLLLTCRGIETEMVSLPVEPIISLVQVNWGDHFQSCPLRVTYTVDEKDQSNLRIAIPRIMWEWYASSLPFWIPRFISPLFRIFTDTVTIQTYEHRTGHPNLYPVSSTMDDTVMFLQLLAIAYARIAPILSSMQTIWRYRNAKQPSKRTSGDLMPPPCRDLFNAKRVEFICDLGQNDDFRSAWIPPEYAKGARLLTSIKNTSIGFNVRGKCLLHVSVDGRTIFDGFVWESDTRFRRVNSDTRTPMWISRFVR